MNKSHSKELIKNIGKELWWILPLFLIVVALLVLGFMKLHNANLNINFVRIVLISTGGLILIIWLIININNNSHVLLNQIHFLFCNAKSAWILGFGLSFVAIGLFLFFPTNGQLFERYDTIFGIITTIFAFTLATSILYKQMSPIIGTEELINYIIEDIKSLEKGKNIVLVYKALNIGFYRDLVPVNRVWDNNSFIDGHPLDRLNSLFFDLLRKKAPKLALAITYDVNMVRELYVAYDNMKRPILNGNIKLDHNATIEACVHSANELLLRFNSTEPESPFKHATIHPTRFPNDVFIIGDYVYITTSYGMPVFDTENEKFDETTMENEVAELVTWRRKDPILAKSIVKHLQNQIKQEEIICSK